MDDRTYTQLLEDGTDAMHHRNFRKATRLFGAAIAAGGQDEIDVWAARVGCAASYTGRIDFARAEQLLMEEHTAANALYIGNVPFAAARVAKVNLELCILYNRMKLYKEAIEKAQAARDLYESIDQLVEMALARCHLWRCRLDECGGPGRAPGSNAVEGRRAIADEVRRDLLVDCNTLADAGRHFELLEVGYKTLFDAYAASGRYGDALTLAHQGISLARVEQLKWALKRYRGLSLVAQSAQLSARPRKSGGGNHSQPGAPRG